MKFCVALKRRIFSSEDKSLDPKSKIIQCWMNAGVALYKCNYKCFVFTLT